jgi:hypothetical protein
LYSRVIERRFIYEWNKSVELATALQQFLGVFKPRHPTLKEAKVHTARIQGD